MERWKRDLQAELGINSDMDVGMGGPVGTQAISQGTVEEMWYQIKEGLV